MDILYKHDGVDVTRGSLIMAHTTTTSKYIIPLKHHSSQNAQTHTIATMGTILKGKGEGGTQRHTIAIILIGPKRGTDKEKGKKIASLGGFVFVMFNGTYFRCCVILH